MNMTYPELKTIFRELKRTSPKEDLTAHITFTEDSFARPYPLLSRTYLVSSDNKGFWPNMFSNSIFAWCLDKTSDQGVRLDWYMADEGNPGGWRVETCYILERMRDTAAIPNAARAVQADGTVCYFFGDTSVRARETRGNGKIRLEPVSGDQAAGGQWADLPMDRVYGYYTLLELFTQRAGTPPAARDRDEELEELWAKFGDVPMDPETERIEEPFLDFPAGTGREQIWRWFDERHSKGAAYLMYGGAGGNGPS